MYRWSPGYERLDFADSILNKLFHKAHSAIFDMRETLRYVRKHKVVQCADEYRQNVAFSEAE
jgi:hypothetical protein